MPQNISPEAKDLLQSLLQKTPTDRITLSSILEHPFLKKCTNKTHYSHSSKYSLLSVDSGNATLSNSALTIDGFPQNIHQSDANTHFTQIRRPPTPPTKLPPSPKLATAFQQRMYVPNNLSTVNENIKSLQTNQYCQILPHIGSNQKVTLNHQKPNYMLKGPVKTNSMERLPNPISNEFKINTQRKHSGNISTSTEVNDYSLMRNLSQSDNNIGAATDRNENETKARCLKELASPLDTTRLKPITQASNHIHIQITEESYILLELYRAKNNTSDLYEVIYISPNGMDITVLRSQARIKKSSITDLQFPDKQLSLLERYPSFTVQSTYTYHNLPARHWKKYQYACQFVEIIRSKTPKVTLHTKEAKCVLMENRPSPEIEISFYDGIKVHLNKDNKTLIDLQNNKYKIDCNTVHKEFSSYIERAYECENECIEIESAIHELEQKSILNTLFPIIIRRRPYQSVDHTACKLRDYNHTTSVSTLSPIPSPTLSIKSEDVSRCNYTSRENLSRTFNSSMVVHSLVKSAFIQNIGWANQLSSGTILIQYNNGSRLQIQLRPAFRAAYTEADGHSEVYTQDKSLPDHLTRRLSQLPLILEALAKSK